jgi:hypothetical protein
MGHSDIAASFACFLQDQFRENIQVDQTGSVQQVDSRVLGVGWRGSFEKLGAHQSCERNCSNNGSRSSQMIYGPKDCSGRLRFILRTKSMDPSNTEVHGDVHRNSKPIAVQVQIEVLVPSTIMTCADKDSGLSHEWQRVQTVEIPNDGKYNASINSTICMGISELPRPSPKSQVPVPQLPKLLLWSSSGVYELAPKGNAHEVLQVGLATLIYQRVGQLTSRDEVHVSVQRI